MPTPERIAVGKQYLTQYGDTVKIVSRQTEDDPEGVPTPYFFGSFVKARKGHENMLRAPNNVARFTADGRWCPRFQDNYNWTPNKSIHDLASEVGQ